MISKIETLAEREEDPLLIYLQKQYLHNFDTVQAKQKSKKGKMVKKTHQPKYNTDQLESF